MVFAFSGGVKPMNEATVVFVFLPWAFFLPSLPDLDRGGM
jgi:hypothetical protein